MTFYATIQNVIKPGVQLVKEGSNVVEKQISVVLIDTVVTYLMICIGVSLCIGCKMFKPALHTFQETRVKNRLNAMTSPDFQKSVNCLLILTFDFCLEVLKILCRPTKSA